MPDTTKRIYEGLFLFPQSAIADMQSARDHVYGLLERSEADVVSFQKWDERRLAYEIKGNKRGLYFLAYFNCDPNRISALERDCNLSESLLRSLVTRADHINPEDIVAADGRTALEDEIKLRSTEAAEQTDGSSSSTVSVASKDEEQGTPDAAKDEEAPATEDAPSDEDATATDEAAEEAAAES